MIRATRYAAALFAASALCAAPRPVFAEPPNARATPVYVLSVWTDDADDQADALTLALRSRVRQAQGWSLAETSQSFETLSIALRCPPRPDAGCLQRIGDQLHADHYVWGTLARHRQGEVTADLHLWSRGKGDAEATEAYSDNLKDASDESLKGIAARLFGKLSGTGAAATLLVHAGTGGGAVLVDGAERGVLQGGSARIDLPAGAHTVAVRVAGFEPTSQQADLAAGSEQDLTFALTPRPPPPSPEAEGRPGFPVRKVLGYATITAGVGLLVAGGIEGLNWLSDKNASDSDRANVPRSVTDVCVDQVNTYAQDACKKSKDATNASTLGWIFAGSGVVVTAVGVWLVLGDHGASATPHDTAPRASARPRLDVLPSVGPRAGSVDLRVTF
jgi:hypothetical protein